MNLSNSLFSLIYVLSYYTVDGAVCNEDDHHPENGGYFIEGIAGFGSTVDPNSDSKRKIHNSTWVPGGGYADGSLKYCTGPYCSEKCKTDGCPDIIAGHTCSKIQFCYEADSGSDVWMMPDEKAMSTCDFTEATPVCNESEGAEDVGCCNFNVEVDADLKIYLFASKAGCAAGQKAAVEINDFADVGDACYGMGLTSSRIKACTCNMEDRETSSLSEPCHSQFIAGCNENAPDLGDDTSCCDSKTCVGNHMNYDHPTGKANEDNRKKMCLDNLPGRCLNTATQSDDCCNTKCTECGIDENPYLSWASCSTGNATSMTGTCGYGGHGGAYSVYECDFSKCTEDHEWHMEGDSYKEWMKAVDPDGYTEKSVSVDSPDKKSSDSGDTIKKSSSDSDDSSVQSMDSVDDTKKSSDSAASVNAISAIAGLMSFASLVHMY